MQTINVSAEAVETTVSVINMVCSVTCYHQTEEIQVNVENDAHLERFGQSGVDVASMRFANLHQTSFHH